MACRTNRSYVLVNGLIVKYKADLLLKDLEGLDAYEWAAKEHCASLCILIESHCENFNLNTRTFFLEIVSKQGDGSLRRINNSENNENDAYYDEDLLPIEGYWEWCDSEWMKVDDIKSEDEIFCRLRRREQIQGPQYFKETLEGLALNFDEDLAQRALKTLLEGLQHERDPIIKAKVANYFQRLLQYTERTKRRLNTLTSTSTLGLLDNLSRSNLSAVGVNIPSRPAVTRDFPLHCTNITSDEGEESDDSFLYCPACSHRFTSEDRVSHLKRCMQSKQSVIGDRYRVISGDSIVGAGSGEECGICYEDLRNGRRVALMNCLCKFHEKCIDLWLRRGKQCPFHSE